MRKLTIYIPGLINSDITSYSDDIPDTPALNWIFSKGKKDFTQTTSPVYRLCNLFGLIDSQDKDLPIAAISRLNDDNQFPEGCWLRADPVHAVADRDSLILFDQNHFNLNQHDALALAAEINILLEPYELKLEVPVPNRWYVKIPDSYDIKTTPIDSVVGQNMLPFMPTGDDANKFIKLMNEIQMTLHDSDINQKREQEKMLPINSVWFWGKGILPEIIKKEWSFVTSDEVITKGLATISATPFAQLPERFDQLELERVNYNGLIVMSEPGKFVHNNTFDNWIKVIKEYEDNWFSPLVSSLKNNQLDQIEILTESMIIRVNKLSRYKFWNKLKHFSSH